MTGKAPVIGVLGGIASGKTMVSQAFQRLGAGRIDADRIGHQVLETAGVRQQLRQRWGDQVFHPDGSVDRRAVAQRVFAEGADGRRQREWLENLTHPRIADEIARQISAHRQQDPQQPLVLDAAVLVEAGWHRFCDSLVWVDAPPHVRQQRAADRGWSVDHWKARERAQGDLESKKQLADFVIDNSGSEDWTSTQVRRVWDQLMALGSRR